MSDQQFVNNDRVRHTSKPEWGVGTVVKVEPVPMNGKATQRVSVRFPNGGLKTLVSSHAELEHVNGNTDPLDDGDVPSPRIFDTINQSDWLAPVAQRKVEETMLSLPPEVRDPFNSMQKRLTIMLSLYRFDRSSRGLMDWAVAQTGLDDPLTRFSRQELEQRFDRWVHERDNHLAKLLNDARNEQSAINAALKTAPPAGRDIVRRITNSR